jgi:predicted DNA-binding transcriptional regulator AlpA
MHSLPPTGYLRLRHIIGSRTSSPPVLPIIPVGRSTWWAGVKSGRFPKPIRLGPRMSAWKVEDIQALIASFKA